MRALLASSLLNWFSFGQSDVRELPLGAAAEHSVHYFFDYLSSFSCGSHNFLNLNLNDIESVLSSLIILPLAATQTS